MANDVSFVVSIKESVSVLPDQTSDSNQQSQNIANSVSLTNSTTNTTSNTTTPRPSTDTVDASFSQHALLQHQQQQQHLMMENSQTQVEAALADLVSGKLE